MVNAFDIIFFYEVVWWFDGQYIGVQPKDQGSIPLTNIYYVEYIYSYICTLYMCVNI
jgi:hypothetical protein